MARSFEHLQPTSLQEACELKANHGDRATFWAGGTDLMLAWQRGKLDIDYCIGLAPLRELRGIRIEDDSITIGSLCTITDLASNPHIKRHLPVLVKMADRFATPQVCNLATIGGNLCHAVPSADAAPPLMVLDASVTLLSAARERVVSLDSFFVGPRKTIMRQDELMVAITVPSQSDQSSQSACTFERMTRSYVDIALASAACRLTVDTKRRICDVRIVMGAVAPVPLRSTAAEAGLLGTPLSEVSDELLAEVGVLAAKDTRPISDVRTTAAYRKHVSKVLVRRAITNAISELENQPRESVQ